jgi:uncharacterized membrane protein YphA (DoxX/SURF4 family)
MITENQTMPSFGPRLLGLGVMAISVLGLIWGTFNPAQPVPDDFPARTVLAYIAAVFTLMAGAAVEWRRSVVWGSAAVAVYFALIVVVLMYGHVMLGHFLEFLTYEGLAVQLALAVGGLIVFADSAELDAALAARLKRLGGLAFGVCALVFGAAHFEYLDGTASLVPKWLPPSQVFWAEATGLCHIAAGIAILTGVQARLAAILLTTMFALFTPLVHVPMLLADPSNHWIWSENATNIAITGAAWIVAASLGSRRDAKLSSLD